MAKSAEFLFRLVPRSVACALFSSILTLNVGSVLGQSLVSAQKAPDFLAAPAFTGTSLAKAPFSPVNSGTAITLATPSPVQPFPTRSEQWSRFVKKTFGWQALVAISAGATFDHLTLRVSEWGTNSEGFEHRLELRAVSRTTGSAVEYGMSQLLQTDTSYHPCSCRGFLPRTRYAIRQTFLEYRADGTAVPAYSRLTGIASGLAISAELLPRHVSSEEMAQRGAIQLGTRFGMNVLREFWPEIRRKMPESLRRL